jgi:DNA (cytosine-5)-methyltransferase 1
MLTLWRMEGATDENGRPVPLWLRFAPDADRALRDFEAWLEPQLADGAELARLAGWGNKLAGTAARIAGILHAAAAVAAGEQEPWRHPVTRTTVEAAIRIGRDYLLPHAMAVIAAVPWNGLNSASTFSGCGGSSLGYKMAGFRVLWANEFIPAAQQTHRANHAGTVLDGRDIRAVAPEDVLAATGLAAGELDLLDGSPPCAPFSTAGRREKGWGRVKPYSDTRQRVDDLFFEFVRLVRGVRPKVFVAENVAGLVRGTAKGYFKDILAAMKGAGYRVEARLLDAQWLGVPQVRKRVIFQGIRADLAAAPAWPRPLPYRYSVREALLWVATVATNRSYKAVWEPAGRPAPAILQGGGNEKGGMVEAEADLGGYAVGREWDRLRPGEKSPKYLNLIKPDPDGPCPTVTQAGRKAHAASVCHPTERRKFTIAELKRVCAFPDDFTLTGTYAQQWERLGRAVPPVMMSHLAAAIRDRVFGGSGGGRHG